jgi:arginine decarboxylase
LKTVTFIISLGNTAEDIEQLVKAFTKLAKEYRKPLLAVEKGFYCKNLSIFNNQEAEPLKLLSQTLAGNQQQAEPGKQNLVLSPRQAFFSSTQTLPIKEAINRISAETVSPYPPGIPLLIPGETITSAVVEHLLNVKAWGGFISNCADTSLCTLKVVTGNG